MSVHLMPRMVYWATDVNSHYLDYLVTLRATRPYMSVSYTNAMDAGSFPRGQAFDTVVCLNVLEHVEDDLLGLRNIHSALRKDGRARPALHGLADRGFLRRDCCTLCRRRLDGRRTPEYGIYIGIFVLGGARRKLQG